MVRSLAKSRAQHTHSSAATILESPEGISSSQTCDIDCHATECRDPSPWSLYCTDCSTCMPVTDRVQTRGLRAIALGFKLRGCGPPPHKYIVRLAASQILGSFSLALAAALMPLRPSHRIPHKMPLLRGVQLRLPGRLQLRSKLLPRGCCFNDAAISVGFPAGPVKAAGK